MPIVYVIAGPNGAGKTTVAKTLLPEVIGCVEYVNADEIAKGLSPFNAEGVAMQAGRLMLERIHTLTESGADFAFETTLSARHFARNIPEWKLLGYKVNLIFFWLDSTSLAEKRVRLRVRTGGHNIPTDVIRRRYTSGLHNFFHVYRNIVSSWQFYNNSEKSPVLIATGKGKQMKALNNKLWASIEEQGK